MKMRSATTLVCLALLGTGCGENSFGGGSGKSGSGDSSSSNGDKAKSEGDAVPNEAKLSQEPPANPTREQDAIGRCLKAWGGKAPFDASVYENYREIFAAVTVFGGGGNAIEDTEVTDAPALVLVHAAVNVLGSANYVLMNPNGWYCMMVDVNVQAQTKIQVQCKAKLADSRVQVNVGSSAPATAAIGVNVLSDVKVERKPSVDSPSGC